MKRLILVVAVLATSCSTPVVFEPVIRPVRTMVPSTMQGELERTFRGAVQASDEAALSFKVGGQVMALNVKVGDVVTADQLLAEIDATELQLKLSQANASLAQARASATVAQTNRDRIQALYVNNNSTAADLDAARANADATAPSTCPIASTAPRVAGYPDRNRRRSWRRASSEPSNSGSGAGLVARPLLAGY